VEWGISTSATMRAGTGVTKYNLEMGRGFARVFSYAWGIARPEPDVKGATRAVHFSLAEAAAKGPPPAGNLAIPIFAHGSLVVELYTPEGHDPQKPHARDEIYFVLRGEGLFFDGERRQAVKTGSFLFVPAGQVHRFEDFSADFAVWVAFYGAEGGEAAGAVVDTS